jgi:hypothetical protein
MTNMTRSGVLACITVAAALTLSASGATAASRNPSQLPAGQLRARLLSTGDLPYGYFNYPLTTLDPTGSSRPACISTLDGLDSPVPPRGVTEASASFAQSSAGPWILETLRSYPGQGAAQTFSSATATLAGCRTFTLSWTSPPEIATETLQPRGSAHLGNQSWSAALLVTTSIPVAESMVVVRDGGSTMLLEVASPVTVPLPTFAQVVAIAARATAKLSG